MLDDFFYNNHNILSYVFFCEQMASTRSVRGPETEDETEHHSLDDLEVVDGEENVEENDSGNKKRKRQAVTTKRSKKTAPYWVDFEEYTDKDGASRVQCKHCEANYVYNSNITGNKNLRMHLPRSEERRVGKECRL